MYAIFAISFATEISEVMPFIFFPFSMELKLDADDKLLLTRLQTCSTAWRHIIDLFWSLQSQNDINNSISNENNIEIVTGLKRDFSALNVALNVSTNKSFGV